MLMILVCLLLATGLAKARQEDKFTILYKQSWDSVAFSGFRGAWVNVFIVLDEETGVEYIIVRSSTGLGITQRAKP